MTQQQITQFLRQNEIFDFVFQEMRFAGDLESVVFDIGRLQITVHYFDGQSLERFKREAEKEYHQALKNQLAYAQNTVEVLQKNLNDFNGIKWKA